MKHLLYRLILVSLLFLAFSCFASASDEGPITSYFSYADSVYVVRVVSEDKNVVTFSVTEALRGKLTSTLILTAEFPDLFKPSSNWLILSCSPWRTGPNKDMVGDFFKGDRGWIFAPVRSAADNDNGKLTVYEIKQLLSQNPEKPWPK